VDRVRPTDKLRCQRGRAQVVVVSLGGQGALLVTAQASQRVPAIKMRSGSGVGAGDAMVAAITVGLSRRRPLPKSVCFGVAAGAAMLMTPRLAQSYEGRATITGIRAE
jgi:6-phosphofructokinase 2